MSLLSVEIQKAGYGKKIVLNNISVNVGTGEIIGIIGPNGSGKSTLLKAIMNMLPEKEAKIIFDGIDISAISTEKIVSAGISFVPQGNRVFTELSVTENLEIGAYLLNDKNELMKRVNTVLNMFPDLTNHLKKSADHLSGGEKQQLALGRALMLKPKLLLLDEPSLGLSPVLAKRSFELLRKIQQETGIALLIVEQKVKEVMDISTRIVAVRMGLIADEGTPDELRQGERLRKIFLL